MSDPRPPEGPYDHDAPDAPVADEWNSVGAGQGRAEGGYTDQGYADGGREG